jgi:hypothetical protein
MGGIGVAAEVLEKPRDDGGRLAAGDDAQPPPQRWQVSISMAKTRLRRCAHVRARCRSVAHASPRSLAAAAEVDAVALGSGVDAEKVADAFEWLNPAAKGQELGVSGQDRLAL